MSEIVSSFEHELLDELARYRRLVRLLRDKSNWTKDGKWSPLMGSTDKNIFNVIEQTLTDNKNEDQPKLPL